MWNYSNWYKLAQTFLNLSKHVEIGLNLSKLVLTYPFFSLNWAHLYGTLLTEKCISPTSKQKIYWITESKSAPYSLTKTIGHMPPQFKKTRNKNPLQIFFLLKVSLYQKCPADSPKKQTNEFAFFAKQPFAPRNAVWVLKANSFVRFLGESEDTIRHFEINWPLLGINFSFLSTYIK